MSHCCRARRPRHHRSRAAWVALVAALCMAPGLAFSDSSADGSRVVDDTKMPDVSVVYSNLTVIRYNPLGLQNRFRIGWRKRLSDSDSVLRKNTYFMASLTALITPSLERVGVRLEFQPLAILQLYAGAEWAWYLGNFDYLTSYKDAAQDYSDTALAAAADRGENYAASGLRLTAGAMLQAKVGPIAVRSNTRAHYHRLNSRASDPVWFDIFDDLLTPRRGLSFIQNNDLLFVKGRLVAGIRHTWSRSMLDDDALAAVPSNLSPRDSTHRVGPFVAYRLTKENKYASSRFRRPTLVLLTQWWVQHPWRTGQDTSQALPWTVLAFTFDGQLSGS